MFLNKKVSIIKLNKDTYKKKITAFNLAISIRIITKNNRLGNTY